MMPPELMSLLKRYIALAQGLPQGDDIDQQIALSDPLKMADTEMVLAEMAKVKAEIDAFLEQARVERS